MYKCLQNFPFVNLRIFDDDFPFDPPIVPQLDRIVCSDVSIESIDVINV